MVFSKTVARLLGTFRFRIVGESLAGLNEVPRRPTKRELRHFGFDSMGDSDRRRRVELGELGNGPEQRFPVAPSVVPSATSLSRVAPTSHASAVFEDPRIEAFCRLVLRSRRPLTIEGSRDGTLDAQNGNEMISSPRIPSELVSSSPLFLRGRVASR